MINVNSGIICYQELNVKYKKAYKVIKKMSFPVSQNIYNKLTGNPEIKIDSCLHRNDTVVVILKARP